MDFRDFRFAPANAAPACPQFCRYYETMLYRQNRGHFAASDWLLSTPDEGWQWRDDWLTRDAETTSEIVPECHAEFGARLGESKEGIAAVTSEVAEGSSADFTPCYLASDVILGAIGMQWDLRSLEDPQQFVLVGIKSCQQAIQGDEACASAKDASEAKS